MNINVLQIANLNMVSKLESGFNVPIDAAESIGGEGKGARPTELFLSSLAGCSGIDVLLILKKARATIHHFNIQIEAKRREIEPKIFTDIKLNFQIEASDINQKQVNRAIDLSLNKYCSVRAMIKDEVKISYSLCLNQIL